jgi:acyl carrier protein
MEAKDNTQLKLLQIIADKLNLDKNKLTFNDSFSDDLGADSLDVYELITSLEKEFKTSISNEDIERITTIGKLVDYISSKQSPQTIEPEKQLIKQH